MPNVHDTFRLDFVVRRMEVVDDETGLMEFMLVPNPERYEWVEKDGERMLWDPVDRTYIPEGVLADAASQLKDMPITFAPPLIEDARRYIASRHDPIAAKLAGEADPQELSDPSAEFLSQLEGDRLDFAVISCDLVGSTDLSGSMEPEDYVRLVRVLSDELGAIAPLFHGHVLKYTGDGLIVYIPGPSRNTQNDLAIDCALTMRGLVYGALNPALAEAGLPAVDVRLGIDSGEAAVTVLGAAETKRHADIIGEVVSLACKVEAAGQPGSIQVGGVAARLMHTDWRSLLSEVEPPAGWSYTDEYGKPYPLYRAVDEPDQSSELSASDSS